MNGKERPQKVVPPNRLFWFLKEGVTLDLSDPSMLELYVQQVVTRGRAEDVRVLLKRVSLSHLKGALEALRRFLPGEVRLFWEDYVAGH